MRRWLAVVWLLVASGVSNAVIIGIEFDGDVVSIDETTGAATLLSTNFPAGNFSNAMARNSAGVIYVTGGQGLIGFNTVNPTTGVVTVGPTLDLGNFESVRGLAFSPADVLYAINQPVPGSFAPPNDLYTINTSTGVGTLIASVPASIQGLAFSPSGILYGWSTGSGEANAPGLVVIDPATGAVTDVNPAVFGNASQVQALAFSAAGVLYGGRSSLYTIDLTTGALTLVGLMGAAATDIRGMEFPTGAPGAPAVSLTPPSLAFGSQLVGTTTASQPLTVQNVGTVILNIASIAASGDFAQTNTCAATLAPSASCTINVTFTPTALGVRNGAVSVASNAAGSPHSSTLSGTGTAVPPGPAVSLTPPALAFGSQLIGATTAAQALTLQNIGGPTLNIASIGASGDFAQTNTCGATLAPTATCTINVTFTPTALGARSGAVTVASDAAGSPHSSALSGTGVAAPPPPGAATEIPTLSEWGLIVLSLLVAGAALRFRRRTRPHS